MLNEHGLGFNIVSSNDFKKLFIWKVSFAYFRNFLKVFGTSVSASGLCFKELVAFMLVLQFQICTASVIAWKSRDRNCRCSYPHCP